MKNLYKLLLVLLFAVSVFPQSLIIKEPISILAEGTEKFLMPKISPDGNLVAISGSNYNNLYLSDFAGNDLRKISELDGSGWNVQWAPTSDCFASRVNFWTDNARIKTSSVYVFFPDGTNKNISGIQEEISTPFWSFKGSNLNWLENDKDAKSFKIQEIENDFAYKNENNALLKMTGEKILPIQEFNGPILSYSVSPNGTRVAIHVAGYGVYVFDNQTNNLYSFGEGESPDWVNDEVLVCMKIKDDGYKLLTGDIYLFRFDGKLISNLTSEFDEIAMYPSASKDGKIVFQAENGKIYKLVIGSK